MRQGITSHYLHWPTHPSLMTNDRAHGCCPSDPERKQWLHLPNTPGAPPIPRVSALVGTLSLAESRPHSRGTLILLPRSEHLEAHAQVQLWTTTLTITQGSRMAPTVTSTTLRHSVSPSSSCPRKCPGSDSLNVCMKTTFIHINYTKGWAYRINEVRNKSALHYVMLWVLTY